MYHYEGHLRSSDIIKDMVIGMADGLTVPFALAAGLSGAVESSGIIITAGIAEIAAGSIAMGLGGFLAGKTEVDHYASELKREYEEVEKFPEIEKLEVREIFAELGLPSHLQHEVAEVIASDKNKWVNFMMRYELGLEKPHVSRARQSAFTIGLAYIVGGIIPLSPYFFVDNTIEGLCYSCGITLIALFIFGFLKSRLTGQKPLRGAMKVVAIGALAALTAFILAKLVNSHL